MRESTGSVAAPAISCRKFRRGSFILNLPPFTSFDHLVGASDHGCRDFQAARLRRLEVNHQLVLGRRLHRKVGRLLAFEDAIDIASRAPEWINRIWTIGDQAAAADVIPGMINGG